MVPSTRRILDMMLGSALTNRTGDVQLPRSGHVSRLCRVKIWLLLKQAIESQCTAAYNPHVILSNKMPCFHIVPVGSQLILVHKSWDTNRNQGQRSMSVEKAMDIYKLPGIRWMPTCCPDLGERPHHVRRGMTAHPKKLCHSEYKVYRFRSSYMHRFRSY